MTCLSGKGVRTATGQPADSQWTKTEKSGFCSRTGLVQRKICDGRIVVGVSLGPCVVVTHRFGKIGIHSNITEPGDMFSERLVDQHVVENLCVPVVNVRVSLADRDGVHQVDQVSRYEVVG